MCQKLRQKDKMRINEKLNECKTRANSLLLPPFEDKNVERAGKGAVRAGLSF